MTSDDNQQIIKQHQTHDKGYKQLLSNKRTFLQLFRTFVGEKWVRDIHEDDLLLVNKTYIQKDFREKEADIVYRLKTGDENIILYIILELQSTVDYRMPFRLLQYIVALWQEIYNNIPEKQRDRKDFRLPAIVPAVLYNGSNNWTACTNFKEMLEGYQAFERYLLDFNYILFDINRYSKEELLEVSNLVSSVFLLDQAMKPEELLVRLKELITTLKTCPMRNTGK